MPLGMRGSRVGIGGLDPPSWKTTSAIGFYRNYIAFGPPPPGKGRIPLEPYKIMVFLKINNWTPSAKLYNKLRLIPTPDILYFRLYLICNPRALCV